MRYELVEEGYVLIDEGCIHPSLPEIAICYMSSAENSKLKWRSQKIGNPKEVQAWAENARQILKKTGSLGKEMAAEIHVIQGRLDIAHLNTVLNDPTAIYTLVQRASAFAAVDLNAPLLIDGLPVQLDQTHA